MVIEQHAYPIFDEDWGADEELLLVEGAETLGLGSWQDIADHIGGRSKDEVNEHYRKVYLESETYPIPNMKRKFTISPTEFAERKRQRLEARRSQQMSIIPKQKPTASVPACHEIQGYMPGRLEFETEVENEAEVTVKDMVFDPEDTEADVDLKVTILDIYNSRLTQRAERKRSILRHGLLEYRKHQAVEKKRTKEERDLINRIKPFARVMTPKDFEEFSESMLVELQCRRRIAELQEYRRAGVRTLEGAAKYERDKAVRLNALSRTGTPAAVLLPTSKYTNPQPSATLTNLVKSQPIVPALGNKFSSSLSNGIDSDRSTPVPNGVANGHSTVSSKLRKPAVNPLDISHASDVELLSPQEQVLCSQLRIMPKPYLAIKETLFRELLKNNGVLKKKTARELIKIDVNKTARIYEFFQSQHWIPSTL